MPRFPPPRAYPDGKEAALLDDSPIDILFSLSVEMFQGRDLAYVFHCRCGFEKTTTSVQFGERVAIYHIMEHTKFGGIQYRRRVEG